MVVILWLDCSKPNIICVIFYVLPLVLDMCCMCCHWYWHVLYVLPLVLDMCCSLFTLPLCMVVVPVQTDHLCFLSSPSLTCSHYLCKGDCQNCGICFLHIISYDVNAFIFQQIPMLFLSFPQDPFQITLFHLLTYCLTELNSLHCFTF